MDALDLLVDVVVVLSNTSFGHVEKFSSWMTCDCNVGNADVLRVTYSWPSRT